MRSLWSSANRWLTWFHRWAGVALCLLFALWFASGAVLHFVNFPSLSAAEARAGGEAIDLAQVRLQPGAALAAVSHATDLRLISIAGRPVYLVQRADDVWLKVAADTGELLPPLAPAVAARVAERFAGVRASDVAGPIDYDQWVVHQRFDPYRPFYRIRLRDRAATDLYVSARTGEVLQRTRLAERAWNWSGAVIHWIYFTPLRRSYIAWNQVVWWVSLAGLASVTVGTWLGIVRYAGNRAAGRSGLSPFRGWMRWHHIIGLGASVIIITWMLSGWLSMDHGRLFSRGGASASEAASLSALEIGAIARTAGLASLAAVEPASQVTFNAVDGRPLLTAYGPAGAAPRVLLLDEPGGQLRGLVPDTLLRNGLNRVWRGRVSDSETPGEYDQLYRLAESAPASAKAFRVAGNEASGTGALRVYVDAYSGRLLAVMDPSRRGYAWIYYALHTLQFPGLIEHPWLRTLLILALLALGFTASITGVVLSYKRLRREFHTPSHPPHQTRRNLNPASET